INTTFPSPPSRAAASISGRATDSLVLTLGKAIHRDATDLGEAIHLTHLRIADLAECRRGRDLMPALPAQELAPPPHRLQLGYIRLQEDPVHRTAGERDVIPK